MTHNTFFIGDTHFGHNNIITFKKNDGTMLRSFASIEEHDETLVKNWNDVVRPQDKVYHLGDVVISRKNLVTCGRLNGHKRLVRGNHDIFKTKEYLVYFEEIYGVRVLQNIIFSHIPIHRDSMDRYRTNVHGHLHSNLIDDPKYINVSCEQVNFTPISLDAILEIMKQRSVV